MILTNRLIKNIEIVFNSRSILCHVSIIRLNGDVIEALFRIVVQSSNSLIQTLHIGIVIVFFLSNGASSLLS